MLEGLRAHGVLIALWVLWCALHSLLAADGVADRIRPRLGRHAGRYRLLYNGVAVATLLPLYLATVAAASPEAWRWRGGGRAVQAALLAAGGWLFLAGGRHYDLRQFLGFGARGGGGLAAGGGLVTRGALGVVRHPWYLAGLLVVWARDLRWIDVWVSLVLSGYLVVGAVLEERRLLRHFGEAYREYRRRVPMLLPLPRRPGARGRGRGSGPPGAGGREGREG